MAVAKNKISSNLLGIALGTALIMPLSSFAIETNIQAHKTSDSGGYGFTLGVANNITKDDSFNWLAAYNRIDNVAITWNDKDIDFSLDTIDLMLSYRYQAKTYNRFLNKLSYELQAGASVVLTENKFIFPDLDDEEKIFSESGDVNAVLSMLVNYKMTKASSFQIGVKYYPDFSEFGSISSAFIGFKYKFGRTNGY